MSDPLMHGLVVTFISREQQKSEYDWANIIYNGTNVGKARCLISFDKFTVFSINIYPGYQGKGYGKSFVRYIKSKYKTVIADRVRTTGIGFWENVGFSKDGETGNWIYNHE